MSNTFIVSLCYNGLLGGTIIADENAITYKTGKLTIPSELRNLEMKYGDIASVSKDKALFLPAVSVHMKNGKRYKFAMFIGQANFFELMKSQGVIVNS